MKRHEMAELLSGDEQIQKQMLNGQWIDIPWENVDATDSRSEYRHKSEPKFRPYKAWEFMKELERIVSTNRGDREVLKSKIIPDKEYVVEAIGLKAVKMTNAKVGEGFWLHYDMLLNACVWKNNAICGVEVK